MPVVLSAYYACGTYLVPTMLVVLSVTSQHSQRVLEHLSAYCTCE